MQSGEQNEILLQPLVLIFQDRGLIWLQALLAVVITPLHILPGFFPEKDVDPASSICSPQGLGHMAGRTEKSFAFEDKER